MSESMGIGHNWFDNEDSLNISHNACIDISTHRKEGNIKLEIRWKVQGRFKVGSRKVQAWFKDGSRNVQEWFKKGSSMVQRWFKDGSRNVQEWFKDGSRKVQGRFKDAWGDGGVDSSSSPHRSEMTLIYHTKYLLVSWTIFSLPPFLTVSKCFLGGPVSQEGSFL